MLKRRIITAIVLISAVLLGIFYANDWLQASILLAICLLAGHEWLRLVGAKTIHKILFYDVLIFCCVVFYYMPPVAQAVLWVSVFGWMVAFFVTCAYQRQRVIWPTNIWITTGIGLWLIVPMWPGLYELLRVNPLLMLFLLILVWSSDIGAYFVGKRWGRHLLMSCVSPGKTWEGALGAVLSTAVIGYITFTLFFPQHMVGLFILGLAIIPVAILGDLFESMVKRIYNVKDSGQLLPGHGGVLDRLDSLTAAAPLFAWGYFLLFAYEL